LGLTASDVRGTLALTPEAMSTLIGLEVPLDEPLPVPFRVRGPLTQPSFAFGNLQSVLRPLAESYLRAHGEQPVRERLDRLLRERVFGNGNGQPEDEAPSDDEVERRKNEVEEQIREQVPERLRGLF
jgi:hypothetical protein